MSGQNKHQQHKQQQRSQEPAPQVVDTVEEVSVDVQDAPVVEETAKVSGTSTRQGEVVIPSTLKEHERLELRTFTEFLDKYITRYQKGTVTPKEDLEAHRSLITAIRLMFNQNEKVLREAFADIINRMSTKQPGNCLSLPTLVKHTHTADIIESSTERVFIAEFLVLLQRFSGLEDKTQIRKRANFEEIFGAIADKKIRDRLEGLFPKA